MKKLIIAVWVTTLLCACGGNIKDPVFKGIENVKLNRVGKAESAVTLDIRYHNPNSFRGLLKRAEGDAWMDSTYLGHFIVDTAVSIPANSEFLVPVKLAVDMNQIVKNSFTAFLKNEVLLRISGKARAGKSGIYKSFSLNYQGMQNLSQLFR
jgi:LEA14-like dessication related protein